ncbi:hypothetical protein [Paraburkholderia xenovorans]|uniref:hypothetical protein n=1 Tax=Paraburkholderia xenovorans TaxID=36873 RepID=UPI0038BD15E6
MLRLAFFRNTSGAWVGDLYSSLSPLLATTHPATIAAAIFSMKRRCIRVETMKGRFTMHFPFADNEAVYIFPLFVDKQMENWFDLFLMFSRTDYRNPPQNDNHADIHFRTAIHHLPQALVRIRPAAPEPKDFAETLKNRNKYIYYPWC